jgi:hypothetical protein
MNLDNLSLDSVRILLELVQQEESRLTGKTTTLGRIVALTEAHEALSARLQEAQL